MFDVPTLPSNTLDPALPAKPTSFAALLSPSTSGLLRTWSAEQLLNAIRRWVGPIWDDQIYLVERVRYTEDRDVLQQRLLGRPVMYAHFRPSTRAIQVEDQLWQHLSRVAAGERDEQAVSALVTFLHRGVSRALGGG